MSMPVKRSATGRARPVLSRRTRRLGHLWIAANVGLAAVLGSVVEGEAAYLVAFVLVGAVVVTPALVLSVVVGRRVVPADRRFWRLYAAGVACIALIGPALLVEVATANVAFVVLVAGPLLLCCTALFLGALLELVRSRGTIPLRSIDLLESAMLVLAVSAFFPVLWGDRPIDPDAWWFTAVAVVSGVGLMAGVSWSVTSFRRVQGAALPEVRLGLAIGIVCLANDLAQVAQGLSGFTLPAAPLLVLQALCFGVVLLIPLHLWDLAPPAYDLLPPLEATRTRSVDAIAIGLLVPLLALTVVRQPGASWVVWWFVGVAFVLLLLATLRGKLAVREARRLYRRVEEAAESRRLLLADLLQRADHDRHRVAAQLHQQATSFYVTFTAFLRVKGGDASHPAVVGLRDDLKRQADQLRELMLAVRPLDTSTDGGGDLRATIVAYAHSLYGDDLAPDIDVRVADDLALDWTTETIVMRIVQEALRNVALHAAATQASVTIEVEDERLVVSVVDDGVGFDVEHVLFESGAEAMRHFAAYLGGQVTIESAPGVGTAVRAVLGGAAEPTEPPPGRWPARRGSTETGPHLRLVPGASNDPA